MSIVVLFFLPDSIESCAFLSGEERRVLRARLQRMQPSVEDAVWEKGKAVKNHFTGYFDVDNALAAAKEPLPYIDALLFFVVNNGYSSIPVYLPEILLGQGFTSIEAQGYSAPPYLAAWIISLVILWVSDRLQVRGPFAVALSAVGAVGYILLAVLEGNWARYGVTFLVTVSLFTMVPMMYMWLMNNQTSSSRKGFALTIFGTIGQCGPILGTRLFPASEKPRYSKGMWISAGLLLFAVVLSALKCLYLVYLNRRQERRQRDSEIDSSHSDTKETGGEDFRLLDIAQRGSDSPYFRYTI